MLSDRAGAAGGGAPVKTECSSGVHRFVESPVAPRPGRAGLEKVVAPADGDVVSRLPELFLKAKIPAIGFFVFIFFMPSHDLVNYTIIQAIHALFSSMNLKRH